MDDRALVRLAGGDRGADQAELAFRILYERYKAEVHGFLLGMFGDRELAEDAIQEAFFRVYTHLDCYDAARPFRPWLFRIVRNAALDQLRSQGKAERLARATRPDEPPAVPVVVAQRESQARTRAALAALSPEARALLIQRHGQGLKLNELAESWSCSERTVRNRLRRAAADLAQALLAHAEGESR